MINKFIGTSVSAVIVFLVFWLSLRMLVQPQVALLVGALFGGMVLLIGGILVFRRSVNVMKDLPAKCPHCGEVLEAAFINNELAMELRCPHCGKLITPEHGVKPNEPVN